MAHEAFRVEWQLGPHRSEAQEALTKDGLSLEQEQSRGRTMTKARCNNPLGLSVMGSNLMLMP